MLMPAVEMLMGYSRLYWGISLLHRAMLVMGIPLLLFLYVLFTFSDIIRGKFGHDSLIHKYIDLDIAQEFANETV